MSRGMEWGTGWRDEAFADGRGHSGGGRGMG